MKKPILIRKTSSICPVCLKKISAEIVEEDEKIVLKKRCDQHGNFRAVHWQSPKLFYSVEKYGHIKNPGTKFTENISDFCPDGCDSCSQHASEMVVAVIDVTNKCDLMCPVCFASSNNYNEMRDPTEEEIYYMLKFLRKLDTPPPAILLSGGEPLIRDDIVKIVRMAHNLKFMVILATNGLKISENPKLAQELKEAGLNIVYLQFDGVTNIPHERLRGARLLKEKLKVIEVCRSFNMEIILVPTLVRGINDAEIGDIIKFAASNADTIRGVVFQPISFTGRNNLSADRDKAVMSQFAEEIERQTHGEISTEDLFPISVMVAPLKIMSRFMDKPWPLFTPSPQCGVYNWVLVSKGQDKTLTPINRLIKFETFMSHLDSMAFQLESKNIGKIKTYIKLLLATLSSINWRKVQSSVGLLTAIRTILKMHTSPSYASLAEIRQRIFLVGCMAFMDQFNFDAERARKCVIHYITPDLQLVPFCVFNNIYRTKAHEETASSYAIDQSQQQLPAIGHSDDVNK